MSDALRQVIAANRAGLSAAIPSVCSAHPDVIAAALALARDKARPIVIEATSNQVNQDGGYTGMTPAKFADHVAALAAGSGIDADHVILGGDHLGPQVWRAGDADAAMVKAHEMVAAYVKAGFTKIHLDCSEGCKGEPAQLGDDLAATRAAALARTCLDHAPDPAALVFVVGTEVPPPGGARADETGAIAATTAKAARATLAAHQAAFAAAGIAEGWAQVGGLVVQPGVEFSPMQVHHLPKDRDPGLRAALAGHDGICLEAHSTDYQHPDAYPRLARMGFAFQKVGPALTFGWRRAAYALDQIAGLAGWRSGAALPAVMEALMLAEPRHWQSHYHGQAAMMRVMRHFGLADRIRYYWPQPAAVAAIDALCADLSSRDLPRPLLAQAFSETQIDRAAELAARQGLGLPRAFLAAAVQEALAPYFFDIDDHQGGQP